MADAELGNFEAELRGRLRRLLDAQPVAPVTNGVAQQERRHRRASEPMGASVMAALGRVVRQQPTTARRNPPYVGAGGAAAIVLPAPGQRRRLTLAVAALVCALGLLSYQTLRSGTAPSDAAGLPQIGVALDMAAVAVGEPVRGTVSIRAVAVSRVTSPLELRVFASGAQFNPDDALVTLTIAQAGRELAAGETWQSAFTWNQQTRLAGSVAPGAYVLQVTTTTRTSQGSGGTVARVNGQVGVTILSERRP